MADTETTPEKTGEGGETTETTTTTTEPTPEGAQNPDAVKRALDAERQAARDAKAQAKAAKAERDQLSEQITTLTAERDTLQSKLTEAEAKVPGLESKVTRYEVAAAKGLDLKLASRLNGSTREEMEADADELTKLLGSGTADDLDGGARETAPKKGTPEQEHNRFLAQLLGASSDD